MQTLKPFVFLILLNPFVHAQTLDELCAYDGMCKQGTNYDGSFIPPKPSVVKILTALKEPMRIVGNELGVDPRAIAGSILAENSMNVPIDGAVHDFWNMIKSTKLGNNVSRLTRHKGTSIGLGGIKIEAAMAIEPFLAKLEKRARHDEDQVRDDIDNPVLAVKYAAAIIRSCQDDYKKQGIDVTKDPAVLATLYNLGNCEELAKATKAKGTSPRNNFFGAFVKRNLKAVGDIVDADRPYDPREVQQEEKDLTASNTKTEMVKSFKQAQPIYSHPSNCNVDKFGSYQGDAGDYDRIKGLQSGDAVGDAMGEFEVESTGIDNCNSEDWTLIRTHDGKHGWIKTSDLEEHSTEHVAKQGWFHDLVYGKTKKCDPSAAGACATKAKNAVGAKDLSAPAEDGLINVKIVGNKKDPDNLNIKMFNSSCLEAKDHSQFNRHRKNAVSLSKADVQEMINLVDQKKKELVTQQGMKDWSDPDNQFASPIDNFRHNLQNCLNVDCSGDKKAMQEMLALDFSKFTGYTARKDLDDKIESAGEVNHDIDKIAKEDPRPKWKKYFKNVDDHCAAFFKVSPPAKDLYVKTKKLANLDDPQSKPPPLSDVDLVSACDLLNLSLEPHPENDKATDANFCAECEMRGLSQKGLLKQLHDVTDKTDYFKDKLEEVERSFKNFDGPFSKCEYDPIATKKRMEALLKLDCVETIYTSDLFQVNALKQYGGRVIFRSFDEDDHFAISIKNACKPGVAK